MTHRLSTITTRTGDDGSTGLGDGSRVVGDCPRVRLLGEADELNSHLGVLLCETLQKRAARALVDTSMICLIWAKIAVPGVSGHWRDSGVAPGELAGHAERGFAAVARVYFAGRLSGGGLGPMWAGGGASGRAAGDHAGARGYCVAACAALPEPFVGCGLCWRGI